MKPKLVVVWKNDLLHFWIDIEELWMEVLIGENKGYYCIYGEMCS